MKKLSCIVSAIFFIFLLISCSSTKSNISENSIEVIFILDKSGSMHGLESDTVGGFNSMIEKQKKEKGKVFITTVLFNGNSDILHNRVPITELHPITEKEYSVGGSTALYDAIGNTIKLVEKNQNNLSKEKKANKILFVITTDGYENASAEYSLEDIKKLINDKRKKSEWEFLFLGANIDAIKTADDFGIKSSNAVNFHSDSKGTEKNYKAIGEAIMQIRQGNNLNSEWKKEIEEDFKNREIKP